MTDKIVDNDKATGSAPSGDMMTMMEEMMKKMATCGCGPMMARMMHKTFSGEGAGEYDPEREMGQQPEDMIQKMAKCGCGPMMAQMMGRYFACQEGDPGQGE